MCVQKHNIMDGSEAKKTDDDDESFVHWNRNIKKNTIEFVPCVSEYTKTRKRIHNYVNIEHLKNIHTPPYMPRTKYIVLLFKSDLLNKYCYFFGCCSLVSITFSRTLTIFELVFVHIWLYLIFRQFIAIFSPYIYTYTSVFGLNLNSLSFLLAIVFFILFIFNTIYILSFVSVLERSLIHFFSNFFFLFISSF